MAPHGHARTEARTLRLHEVALRNLCDRPALRQACLALVTRWLGAPVHTPSRPWLEQWREMLEEWPLERIARVVLDPDGGQTLRQCSPLGPALTPQERWAVLAEVDARRPHTAGGAGQ